MLIASIFFMIVVAYLLTGAVFAIPFLLSGIHKIDTGTTGSTVSFKIIIAPGVIVFWPFLLRKWLKTVKTIKP